MKLVFHMSMECYPVAKVGGLADVVGALPKYQNKAGITAKVVMPWYDKPFYHTHEFVEVFASDMHQSHDYLPYKVFKEKSNVLGFELYCIQIPAVLDRPNVYGYADESYQFIAFQHAVLDWFCKASINPDIIHCHDYHTGFVPFMIKNCPVFQDLRDVSTIGTIHNGEYQGWMSWSKVAMLPQFDSWKGGLLDWNGVINPLACLIKCADFITTVSQGYLEELTQKAHGLEELFRQEHLKCHGIINGIDAEVWNPETDEMLEVNYKNSQLISGKKANKKVLCQQYNLDPDLPLFSFIGRFAIEKGADLLPEFISKIFHVTQGKINLIVLGSGDINIENQLLELQLQFAKNFGLDLGYKEYLSHQLYASSDFLLMPSRVEPCGLNQMYAMRYGTIPIVRYTGGLKDTVLDISLDNGYGIVFGEAESDAIIHAVVRALKLKENSSDFKKIRTIITKKDFSWESSTEKYLNLYTLLKP